MEKKNTNDLVQYLYQETSPEHKALIEKNLQEDMDLQKECSQLESTISELQNLSYSPSQSTVDKILNYARSLEKCA